MGSRIAHQWVLSGPETVTCDSPSPDLTLEYHFNGRQWWKPELKIWVENLGYGSTQIFNPRFIGRKPFLGCWVAKNAIQSFIIINTYFLVCSQLQLQFGFPTYKTWVRNLGYAVTQVFSSDLSSGFWNGSKTSDFGDLTGTHFGPLQHPSWT